MKNKWVHAQNKKLHICDPENKASHTSYVWSLKLPPLKPIDIKHPPTLELDPRSHKTAETELPVCVVGGAMGVEIHILCLLTSAFKLRCYLGAAHFGFRDSLSSAWSMLWCRSGRLLSPTALSIFFLILGLQSWAMDQAFQHGFWRSVPGSSWLQSKCFSNWAVYPVPKVESFGEHLFWLL